jgi:hypothetical protein
MAILAGDVKLIASAVMSDVPEGGGAPTANVIQDATSNGIFNDISELDRAGGRVNLRKVFPSIRTANTDGYFGANVIVAEPPQDPRVSITLFTTGDVFDQRTEAASRMEAYLAKGATYAGYLFGDHIAGQMSVTVLQREEVPAPVVGATLVLTKNIGLSNEFVQFVRVTGVESTVRSFTTSETGSPVTFTRLQCVCSISDQLQEDFPGFDAKYLDASINYTGKTKLNETIVADAARYYGVVPLEGAVSIGDFSVQAEGIFTQLVPSTRIEVPIADARMNQQLTPQVATGANVSRLVSGMFSAGNSLFVGGSITPGTLSITRGGVTVTDKGGLLVNGSTQVGTVDYANGVLTLSTDAFGTGGIGSSFTVAYTVAATPTLVNRSRADKVTPESQRLSYTTTLDPVPVKGTLTVSFRALGRWYVLKDDGSGALRGADSSAGAGSVNFSTGTVSVTLGALPDVGTAVIYTWGSPSKVQPVTPPTGGSGGVPSPEAPSTVTNNGLGRTLAFSPRRPIKPGTVTVTWNDGTARTATDNSTRGLTGAATGRVDYATGTVFWQPNVLPPKGTVVTLSIGEVSAVDVTTPITLTNGGSVWTHTLGAVQANTFRASITFNFTVAGQPAYNSTSTNRVVQLYDNGSGSLRFRSNGTEYVAGTINYATGALSITKTIGAVSVSYQVYSGLFGGLDVQQVTASHDITFNNQIGSASYTNSASDTAQSVDITLDAMEYQLQHSTYAGGLYGGSSEYYFLKEFTVGPNRYVVVGDTIRMNVSPETGVGTAAGTYSYGGQATITEWSSTSPTVAGVAAVTGPQSAQSDAEVGNATFRTAVSPLVNSGFNLAGNWIDGTAFSFTANASGVISSGSAAVDSSTDGTRGVFAYVDYESGIVSVYFGRRTLRNPASDPLIVDITSLGLPGVTTIALQPVSADTLRYNAVGYSYLPLDPDILGLNPVRLPADGRVPIFRPGTFAVLGHAAEITATVTNGQTINCARTRLSRVRVIGNNGAVIDTGYTADLDLGTVTFSNVTGYSQPVTIEHRVEDMMLVSDAQISGQVSFTRAVTHAYPVPGSYLSSALVAGDVQARASIVFDQASWTNVWQDSIIGSSATGTYNTTAQPITVTNLGALTERWALRFTNTTTFDIIGEHVGVIGTGNTGTDCAPLNPTSGVPYFTVQSEGWGAGWSTGNVLRFNTVGAQVPVWVARTILQGPETTPDDSFTILVRGDVDRP